MDRYIYKHPPNKRPPHPFDGGGYYYEVQNEVLIDENNIILT
jgi:hypothetical protein